MREVMNAEKMAFFLFLSLFFSLFLSGQKSRQKKGLLILCTGMLEPGEQGGVEFRHSKREDLCFLLLLFSTDFNKTSTLTAAILNILLKQIKNLPKSTVI
jgi:hypothetical protein